MNKALVILFLFGLAGSTTIMASDDLPSCDDLVEIANVFDEVSTELAKIGHIEEDSELDKALRDCVTALDELSGVENNERLSKSVNQLAQAWLDMDWETFKLALDSMIANLDRIRREDCE